MANLCREAALGPIRNVADIQCIEADQVPCYFLAWILRCFIDYFSMWLGTGQKYWGGWAGAFGNVVDKKHRAHPLSSAQKWLAHP